MPLVDSHGDLALCAMVLAALSGLLFWCSRRLAQRCPAWVSGLVAGFTLLATLAFVARCYGNLDLARVFPSTRVIVLSNLIPVGAAVLAGMVAGQQRIPAWRRSTTIGMLLGLAWYTVVHDLYAAAPRPGNPRFQNGASMQSTPDSCSVCCAVTLLLEHGITARESEMIDLCLTRRGGTPELGLFRGLKLKTERTPWDVQVLSCGPEAFLQPDAYPAILLVDADAMDTGMDPPWWYVHRATHAVIACGITDSGKIAIRDPSAGSTSWTYEHFCQRWYGDGLRLVRRPQDAGLAGR
jgi:hypothetical protein